MPYLLSRLLLTLALWAGSGLCTAWAANQASVDALVLGDANSALDISAPQKTWLEPGQRSTVQGVADSANNFVPTSAFTRHALNGQNTLWVKLRLVRAAGNSTRWTLNIPLPSLDSVTLYQRTDGGWQAQSAGDQLPQSDWNTRGLYPDFTLDLPNGVAQDVYLQVRNFKPISIPIRLAAGTQRETQKLQEIALLGLMTGVLLTMSLMSLLRHLEHHNPLDRTAALYGLLAAASVAQINGGLNALLWQNLPTLADYASEVIPVMAMGCALLLVRKLYTLSTHYHRYDQVLEILGWCTLGSVLGYMLLDHATADQLGGLALALATAAGLLASLISWRSGAPIGGWLVLAYAPHFGVVLWHIGESMGWTPPHWEMRYGYSLTLACSVGLLSYALSRATHDRKEVELRADLLQTQDALTGLLTASIFQGHLESAYQRAIANREPIALVLVSVTNHERIRTTLGDTTAEQCLLRAVIKLHRILRDVDPAARVGSARFALLLEGVENRQTLTERLVKLVASGLIPLQGLQPEVTLQFQAACVLLHQNPVAPARVMNDLSDVLAGISPRTRRPIRFLDPTPTQAAPLAPLVKTA